MVSLIAAFCPLATFHCPRFRKPPAGIEPARPPYQDGKLPLHHRGGNSGEWEVDSEQCLLSALTTSHRPLTTIPKSAQRESNPRFRHGKTAGYRYITGAYQLISINSKHQQWKRWESNPRTPA